MLCQPVCRMMYFLYLNEKHKNASVVNTTYVFKLKCLLCLLVAVATRAGCVTAEYSRIHFQPHASSLLHITAEHSRIPLLPHAAHCYILLKNTAVSHSSHKQLTTTYYCRTQPYPTPAPRSSLPHIIAEHSRIPLQPHAAHYHIFTSQLGKLLHIFQGRILWKPISKRSQKEIR